MSTFPRRQGEQECTIIVNGGIGGSGGPGVVGQGGKGGRGGGPRVNVIFQTSSEAHILPGFAPSALFDADAAQGGSARRACTDQTRGGLISRLKEWSCDTPKSSSIFWLSGMAGTGKSTVAYTLCQYWDAQGRLGASFFCSRNDEKARSRRSIIPTIVQQLLRFSRPFAHSVGNVHISLVIPASTRHLDELLIQPWLSAIGSQSEEKLPTDPLVVVIDALDEIEDNEQARQLIKQLIQAISASEARLPGLKFLVTSRPHPRIVEECSSIDGKAVYHMEEIAPKEASEDVRRFVDAELPALRPERREDIVYNSSGLFIYAATVVRYLCPPNYPLSAMQQEDRLDDLTAGRVPVASDSEHELLIDSLYKTILTQALPKVGREVETSKRVLYAVVTTCRPLMVSDLAPLVVDAPKKADEVAVRNSLSMFYAVLYVSSGDKCIYALHKSFANFILDLDRSPDLAKDAMSYFPKRIRECFRIMNESLCFNICKLTSSFLLDEDDEGLSGRTETNIRPELRYACQHWAAHLTLVQHDCEDVQQLSALLLDFCDLKVLFWMEAMNLLKWDCHLAIQLSRTWAVQVQHAELDMYLAASQRLWAAFVRSQASLSTPHIYISSLATELALASAGTLTSWRKHFPGLPSIECKGVSWRGIRVGMEGHSESVGSVVISPDGARVVSGWSDKTVRIWHATTERLSHLLIHKMDGWVVLRENHQIRLFWYPPEFRDTVLVSRCHSLGPNWEQIQHPPPTYHYLTWVFYGLLLLALLWYSI